MNKNYGTTKYLIGFCIVIFILQQVFNPSFTNLFALFYLENPQFGYWQFISHMFLHSPVNYLHIIFNMYVLWSFGSLLEHIWGSKTFILFFIIAGLGAGLIYSGVNYFQHQQLVDTLIQAGINRASINEFLTNPVLGHEVLSILEKEEAKELYYGYHESAVGASGAIYGLLVAFAMNFPKVKMYLIFLPIPIPAMYFMPLLIGFDLFFGLTSHSIGNIAHFAHIGGAVIGFIIATILLLKAGRPQLISEEDEWEQE